MKTTKILLSLFGLAAVMTACSTQKDDDPTGSWVSSAPQTVTADVEGSSSATKTISFDFLAPVSDNPGDVTYTADYNVTVPGDSTSESISYQVTASIKGTWSQDVDDHDDYVLAFDTNTLNVTGTNAPELGPVTDEFLKSVATFTSIEDVEVSKDGTHMKFETEHPDVKYQFVKK